MRDDSEALGKKQRGALRALLEKVTGYSLAQVTRLIRQYRESGEIQPAPQGRQRFPGEYTVEDLELWIEVARAHQRLSGPATRRIVGREWHVFGKVKCARRGISVWIRCI